MSISHLWSDRDFTPPEVKYVMQAIWISIASLRQTVGQTNTTLYTTYRVNSLNVFKGSFGNTEPLGRNAPVSSLTPTYRAMCALIPSFLVLRRLQLTYRPKMMSYWQIIRRHPWKQKETESSSLFTWLHRTMSVLEATSTKSSKDYPKKIKTLSVKERFYEWRGFTLTVRRLKSVSAAGSTWRPLFPVPSVKPAADYDPVVNSDWRKPRWSRLSKIDKFKQPNEIKVLW